MAENITSRSDPQRISVEPAARRTGQAFQRTRMSADRALMSVIRTSLSLLSFGFTISQVFEKLRDAGTIAHAGAASNFGIALVILGILMLFGGIVYHLQFYARPSPCAAGHESGGPHSRRKRLSHIAHLDYRNRAAADRARRDPEHGLSTSDRSDEGIPFSKRSARHCCGRRHRAA
jgi:Domain of unknown function (DUF202)